jgi:anaerobic dimethyl sulfoxide reductase subunit C (anchor subunit)
VPAWNNWATLVFFFATTILLGAVAISAAFVGAYAYLHTRKHESSDQQRHILAITLRWMALVSLVVLGIQLVVQPIYMGYLASAGPVAAKSASILIDEHGALFALRFVLLFLGAGLFSFFIYKFARSARNLGMLSTLAFAAFALVLAGELIGRYLFYASFARIGPM